MQLLVRTESSQSSTSAAQAIPATRPPYFKAYQQQSHLLRELALQRAKHEHFQQALVRKQRQLSAVSGDDSPRLSVKLLRRQVQCLEYHSQKCEDDIATLRAELNLNMVQSDDLKEEEQEQISSALLSAASEMFDFEIDWPVSSAFAPAAAYHAVLDQELAKELEQVSLDMAVEGEEESIKSFVPAAGWDNVLGTWV